jgi:hypothetical protein
MSSRSKEMRDYHLGLIEETEKQERIVPEEHKSLPWCCHKNAKRNALAKCDNSLAGGLCLIARNFGPNVMAFAVVRLSLYLAAKSRVGRMDNYYPLVAKNGGDNNCTMYHCIQENMHVKAFLDLDGSKQFCAACTHHLGDETFESHRLYFRDEVVPFIVSAFAEYLQGLLPDLDEDDDVFRLRECCAVHFSSGDKLSAHMHVLWGAYAFDVTQMKQIMAPFDVVLMEALKKAEKPKFWFLIYDPKPCGRVGVFRDTGMTKPAVVTCTTSDGETIKRLDKSCNPKLRMLELTPNVQHSGKAAVKAYSDCPYAYNLLVMPTFIGRNEYEKPQACMLRCPSPEFKEATAGGGGNNKRKRDHSLVSNNVPRSPRSTEAGHVAYLGESVKKRCNAVAFRALSVALRNEDDSATPGEPQSSLIDSSMFYHRDEHGKLTYVKFTFAKNSSDVVKRCGLKTKRRRHKSNSRTLVIKNIERQETSGCPIYSYNVLVGCWCSRTHPGTHCPGFKIEVAAAKCKEEPDREHLLETLQKLCTTTTENENDNENENEDKGEQVQLTEMAKILSSFNVT